MSTYCSAIQNGYQLIFQYFGQIPIAKGSSAGEANRQTGLPTLRAYGEVNCDCNSGKKLTVHRARIYFRAFPGLQGTEVNPRH